MSTLKTTTIVLLTALARKVRKSQYPTPEPWNKNRIRTYSILNLWRQSPLPLECPITWALRAAESGDLIVKYLHCAANRLYAQTFWTISAWDRNLSALDGRPRSLTQNTRSVVIVSWVLSISTGHVLMHTMYGCVVTNRQMCSYGTLHLLNTNAPHINVCT